MDGTTQTLVGGDGDDEGLFRAFWGLGLSSLEEVNVGFVVDSGRGHGLFGLTQSGGGDNLHGLGDLLNVLNRL